MRCCGTEFMRLFEAIMDANHRALAGDANAGLHPTDFANALPVAALTCIDARLNPLFPEVLALPKEQFIWLRNAGNIITGPMSSTMRSLALACAIKGGKEIAIIGHTDCLVGKTSTMKLTDALRAQGVDRAKLPENLTEYFGMFASERQNVIKAVDLEMGAAAAAALSKPPNDAVDAFKPLGDFKMGEMSFPTAKIGEIDTGGSQWKAPTGNSSIPPVPVGTQPPPPPLPPSTKLPPPKPAVVVAPRIPVPPQIRPHATFPPRRKN
jgi:carbonic anhydrase